MRFWLGTHKPRWLSMASMPLMVSHRTLREIPNRRLPVASVPWVLDSGAFTELSTYGYWTIHPSQYVSAVRRYQERIGRLQWASIQDWMCESFILAKTGLDVQQHQRRTVESFLTLVKAAPDIPWLPILQGWTLGHYHACADLYESEGIHLSDFATVGLGSVCRRQATGEIEEIVRSLAGRGYRLHGFGMKLGGLARCMDVLESSDSLAWSFLARRSAPLAGHTHSSCANCYEFAATWYEQIESLLNTPFRQMRLPV